MDTAGGVSDMDAGAEVTRIWRDGGGDFDFAIFVMAIRGPTC